jgi:raffinose/stachyose/melibiose transport system substrate-binding protein
VRKKVRLFLPVGLVGLLALSFTGQMALAQAGKELVVWEQFIRASTEKQAFVDLVKKFEKEHPGVAIKDVAMDNETMERILKTTMAAGTGPDICYYGGMGPAFVTPLAKAGLLLDLNSIVEEYKDVLQDYGASAWEGIYVTIAFEKDLWAAHYNREIFDKLGLSEPKTWTNFLDVLDKLKNAGYYPLALGNAGAWPAGHMFSLFCGLSAGPDEMRSLLFGDGSWNQPLLEEGVGKLKLLHDKGYFNPGVNSLSYEDANALFYAGKAAINWTGLWLLTEIIERSKFKVGAFFVPTWKEFPTPLLEGIGSGWYVYSGTKYPELAREFIKAIYTPDVVKKWVAAGIVVPFKVDLAGLEMQPLRREILEKADLQRKLGGGSITNTGVLMSAQVRQTMFNGVQAIFTGETTAKKLLDKMQNQWAKDKAAGLLDVEYFRAK